MNFEYVDIILLAMIAGFIFLRLRGILGRKTGFEENISTSFPHDVPPKTNEKKIDAKNFDENAKKEFLNGAKIAYETIITNFATGDLKKIKSLLDNKIFDQFKSAIQERETKGLVSDTTFIGISSAEIKDHKETNNILEVTVDFVSEIISCIKDKDNNVLSGDHRKIKKVHDTWKFSKDIGSKNLNWLLIDTQT